jgi:hypothetical protein
MPVSCRNWPAWKKKFVPDILAELMHGEQTVAAVAAVGVPAIDGETAAAVGVPVMEGGAAAAVGVPGTQGEAAAGEANEQGGAGVEAAAATGEQTVVHEKSRGVRQKQQRQQ